MVFSSEVFGDNPIAFLWYDRSFGSPPDFHISLQMNNNWLLREFVLSVAARSCNEIMLQKKGGV